MTEYEELRKSFWEKADLTLPSWALRKSWENTVQSYLSNKTGDLCPDCQDIIKKRDQIRRKLR